MNGIEKRELPWWQKYTLTLNEASEYFGIGYKKLKMFVQEHSDEDVILWNGNRALIVRLQPIPYWGVSHQRNGTLRNK